MSGIEEKSSPQFTIVDINTLKPHEEVDMLRVKELVEIIRRNGTITMPIPVEMEDYIILDGHHRYHALIQLKCKKAPVYLIDYWSVDVVLELWPGAVVNRVKKEEVIMRALSGELFPPKTTRHIFKFPMFERAISVEDLI